MSDGLGHKHAWCMGVIETCSLHVSNCMTWYKHVRCIKCKPGNSVNHHIEGTMVVVSEKCEYWHPHGQFGSWAQELRNPGVSDKAKWSSAKAQEDENQLTYKGIGSYYPPRDKAEAKIPWADQNPWDPGEGTSTRSVSDNFSNGKEQWKANWDSVFQRTFEERPFFHDKAKSTSAWENETSWNWSGFDSSAATAQWQPRGWNEWNEKEQQPITCQKAPCKSDPLAFIRDNRNLRPFQKQKWADCDEEASQSDENVKGCVEAVVAEVQILHSLSSESEDEEQDNKGGAATEFLSATDEWLGGAQTSSEDEFLRRRSHDETVTDEFLLLSVGASNCTEERTTTADVHCSQACEPKATIAEPHTDEDVFSKVREIVPESEVCFLVTRTLHERCTCEQMQIGLHNQAWLRENIDAALDSLVASGSISFFDAFLAIQTSSTQSGSELDELLGLA